MLFSFSIFFQWLTTFIDSMCNFSLEIVQLRFQIVSSFEISRLSQSDNCA